MSMNYHSPTSDAHESLKDTLGALWENKPLFITMVVGLLVGGYVLYKHSSAAVIAPAASTASGTATTPASYTNISTIINKTILPVPSGAPGQVALTGQPPTKPIIAPRIGIIRAKMSSGIDARWDSTHSGVPVRPQPSDFSGAVVRYIPFGGSINLLGPQLTGQMNQSGGSSTWYPVAGGYISAWDLATIR